MRMIFSPSHFCERIESSAGKNSRSGGAARLSVRIAWRGKKKKKKKKREKKFGPAQNIKIVNTTLQLPLHFHPPPQV